nr:PlmG [Aspergillus flavipes]
MGDSHPQIRLPTRPSLVDVVELRQVEFPLPVADEAWHRQGKSQPCRLDLRLFFSSIAASAASDDVGLTLDYGRLYRQLKANVQNAHDTQSHASTGARRLQGVDGVTLEERLLPNKQDLRLTAGVLAVSGLELLLDCATSSGADKGSTPAIQSDFGQCEVVLRLPKAVLRANDGLRYRSLVSLAQQGPAFVILEEEIQINGIQCYCVVGINPHERREKQGVMINLGFKGPGNGPWVSTVLDSYQEMTRAITDEVEVSSFGSVEALATLVAKVATVGFGNEQVTVRLEKSHALAFVEGSGLEITRSKSFFEEEER